MTRTRVFTIGLIAMVLSALVAVASLVIFGPIDIGVFQAKPQSAATAPAPRQITANDILRIKANLDAIEIDMQRPAVYQPVGEAMAICCQSSAAFKPVTDVMGLNTQWLPAVLRKVADITPSYVVFGPEDGLLGMGGGFFHWGYSLERDPARSTPTANTWTLMFFWEGSPGRMLTTFTTDPAKRYTSQEFIASAIADYDRQIAATKSIDPFRYKIFFLQAVGRDDAARTACRDALRMLPDSGWAVMTVALMDAANGHAAEAQAAMTRWADAHPSHSRYVLLAHYFSLRRQAADAANAAEKADRLPIVEEPDDEYLGDSDPYQGFDLPKLLGTPATQPAGR